MTLKKIVRRVLLETSEKEKKSSDALIEKYVEKHYTLEFEYDFIPRLETHRTRVVNIKTMLVPKDVNHSSKKDDTIVFYSTWVVGNGTVTLYDSNTAYIKYEIFGKMGLEKELDDWFKRKSKQYVSKKFLWQ